MSKPAVATLLLLTSAAVGCVDERQYIDPDQALGDAWGNGAAALRGDVGELRGIDTLGTNISAQSDPRWVSFSGDVPHQSRSGSSVFIAVEITNAHRLPIGAELRQAGTSDDIVIEDEPVLSVYICPNGEGVSGSADDIVVKRIGRESFTFIATSSVPEQNLDVDLGVGSAEEAGILQAELMRPAPTASE